MALQNISCWDKVLSREKRRIWRTKCTFAERLGRLQAADQQCKDPQHPKVPRADRDVYPSGRDVTLALRHCHSSEPRPGQAVALFQLRHPACRFGVFLGRGPAWRTQSVSRSWGGEQWGLTGNREHISMAGAPSNGSNSQHLESFGRGSVTAAMSALLKGTLCGDGPCTPHCSQPAWPDSACPGASHTFQEPLFHPQRSFASSG